MKTHKILIYRNIFFYVSNICYPHFFCLFSFDWKKWILKIKLNYFLFYFILFYNMGLYDVKFLRKDYLIANYYIILKVNNVFVIKYSICEQKNLRSLYIYKITLISITLLKARIVQICSNIKLIAFPNRCLLKQFLFGLWFG